MTEQTTSGNGQQATPDGELGCTPPTTAAAGAEAGPAAAPVQAPPTPEQQLAEMKDRWLRACAEVENVRRRGRLDLEDCRRHGAAPLLLSLLPVLDSLQRALDARPQDGDAQLWAGVELARQLFVSSLAAHGVTPLAAVPGTPFDPSNQKAVLELPTDEHPPGTVIDELVRGYRLHDRLLRESQVTVACRPGDRSADAPAPHDSASDDDADV